MEFIICLSKWIMACGTICVVAFLILLSVPQCRLRSIGMQIMKWLMAAGLILLVVSPIDFLPDIVPVLGWADDLAYLFGAVCAARSASNEGKRRAELDCLPPEDAEQPSS